MQVITVLHDPDLTVYNRFIAFYESEELFDSVNFSVVLSRQTPFQPYDDLMQGRVFLQSFSGLADARRNALRLFLDLSDEKHLLLCDFDRLLFWLKSDRETFFDVLHGAFLDGLTVIGRTVDAMATHPEPQNSTEGNINGYLFARLLAQSNAAEDVTAGTYVMTKPIAQYLFRHSHAIEAGAIDVEWIALVELQLKQRIDYLQVGGLAFEGRWIGTEPIVTPEVAAKRFHNLRAAQAFVDTVLTWRTL